LIYVKGEVIFSYKRASGQGERNALLTAELLLISENCEAVAARDRARKESLFGEQVPLPYGALYQFLMNSEHFKGFVIPESDQESGRLLAHHDTDDLVENQQRHQPYQSPDPFGLHRTEHRDARGDVPDQADILGS